MQIENAKIYWAKVIGAPVAGYDEGSKEWSFDISVDDATVDGKPAMEVLKAAGLGPRIKNKGDDKGNFLHLKRNAVKKDGEAAKPIRVVDNQNNVWGEELIGNGSIVNVQTDLGEYGTGKAKKITMRPLALQVWQHQKYEGKNSFKTKSDVSEDKVSKEW